MAISFNEVPATLVPFVYIEIDNAGAVQGTGSLQYRCLLIGSATDAGTASAEDLVTITSASQASAAFGAGSQLHLMAKAFLANNAVNVLKAAVVAVEAVATLTNKAAGTIQATAAATADGVIYLYLAGQRLTVDITEGDVVADIATAIDAAITDTDDSASIGISS